MFFPGKDRKEQKIEEILTENYNSYYRLAYSYVRNGEDAADIVQNGAYRAILNSSSLKKEEYAKTWVYRIMLNEIFRFTKKETALSLDEVEETGKEDRYEEFDLKRALQNMPQKEKAVIELKYFEDMKLEEIAQILEENVNTVKSRLYRGLKKLRLELSDAWQWEEEEGKCEAFMGMPSDDITPNEGDGAIHYHNRR